MMPRKASVNEVVLFEQVISAAKNKVPRLMRNIPEKM
jgi:hypothetical protein